MACDCIAKMNDKLAPHNSRVVGLMCWTRVTQPDGTEVMGDFYDTVAITCEKIEPRKRDKVSALPTFCPFCGTRYLPEASADALGPDA